MQLEVLEDRLTPSNWVVTTSAASGLGSLAAAVASANTDTSPANITFAAADFGSATTITLTATLTLSNTNESITINGAGAGPITVSGNHAVGVFAANAGVTTTIENLSIIDGSTAAQGGGIYNAGGTVTVNNCILSGNTSGNCGGAIANWILPGIMTVTGCTITGNSAVISGGGLQSGHAGDLACQLTVTNTTIQGNTSAQGAGVNVTGTATLTNCTIQDNTATAGDGAGLCSGGATVTIHGGTITGNSASATGGGIGGVPYLGLDAIITLDTNATVTNNTAAVDGGGIGFADPAGTLTVTGSSMLSGNSTSGNGGGIYDVGTATINSSTISGNSAGLFGGGIDNVGGTVTVTASIVSGNSTTIAFGSGGGAGIATTGVLTLTNSTIDNNISVSGNGAPGYGGGAFWLGGGTLTATGCTISGNAETLAGECGGVIETFASATIYTLTFQNCTITGNSAADQGGALNLSNTVVTINDTTIKNNTAATGPGGAITSSCASLTIENGSVISGNTAGTDGGGVFLEPFAGVTPTLTVDGSTITGNTGFDGAGVYVNAGSLTVQNASTISNNTAANEGGGIYNVGAATVTGSTISGNTSNTGGAFIGGGGVQNAGTMTIDTSTISTNTSNGFSEGGAINNNGTMTLTNSTISGNLAGFGAVGAFNGQTTIIGCTLSGNTSTQQGGALWLSWSSGPGTSVTVMDSTISGNSAPNGGGVGTNNMATLTLTLSNCTIAGNTGGSGNAGGISAWAPATVIMNNTIVAGNSSGAAESDIVGAVSGSSNLVENGTGMSGLTNGTNGNQVGTAGAPINPLLGPLQNNGGSTLTMAPKASSPAVNAAGSVTTASAIADGVTTSVTVANVSVFSAEALPTLASGSYFTIQIDSERMAVTGVTLGAGGSGTLTVVRGADGTTAVAHAASAPVYIVSDQTDALAASGTPPKMNVGAVFATSSSTGSIIVTTASDAVVHTGFTSLRDAVTQANADAATGTSDTITFAAALNGQTVTLTQGTLALTGVGGTITIDGANQITVSGNNAVGDFSVASGGSAKIDGLAIIDGKNATNGAGIENKGTLTVSNCTISNDTSTGTGGGINNETTGVLTVSDCTVSANSATGSVHPIGSGGGIFNYGTAYIDSCVLTANTCANYGAALAASNATTNLSNSLIKDNSSAFTSGGLNIIYGSLTVTNCTFEGNTAVQGAAGLSTSATSTITNSTFTNNVAGGIWGGAVLYETATEVNPTLIANCTIVGNTYSGAAGGGIYNNTGSGNLTLVNCIVAENTATADPDVHATVTGNNNLIGIGASGLIGIANGTSGNIVGTAAAPINPALVPIGNFGGTLPTMPLFSTSPAIGVGGNVTTLTNAILAGDTSIVVGDAQAVASTALPVVIQIDNEQMLVTAVNLATKTLTVTRGFNSTAAAGHNAGAGVVIPQDEIGQSRISAGQSNLGAVATVATVTFTTQPTNSTVGSTFSVAIHVSASNGATMSGVALSLGISASSLSGTTTATTDSSGNATFSNLSVAGSGTFTLTVLSNGAVTATSNPFSVMGVVSTLSFATQPPVSVAAGGSFSPVVLADDGSGNPVANATLTIAISSGTLNGTLTATTNASGLATFPNLSVDIAGTYTLTAKSGAINVLSNSFTVTAAAPASLAFVTQPTGTTAGSTLSPVVVQAVDAFGNVEGAGVSVTVALSSGVLNGTLTGATNGSGQVSFSNLSINAAGTCTLLASSTGLTGATSNSFVIAAGPGIFTFLTQPLGTTAGTVLNAITVQVADAFSNPLSGVTVTIGIPPAALSGGTTTATTNSAGQVVFNNLVENLAGTYSLTAAATGLTSVSSNAFIITAAAAFKLSYLSQPSSTTAGNIVSAVTVQVVDKFGNAVTGSTIGIATTSGTLSAGTTPLTSNASGQVVFSDLAENVVGTYTLTASSTGVANVLSSSFTITAAGVATLAFVSQPVNATAGNVLNSVSVKALDPFGNVVPGIAVSIGIAPGSLASGTLVQTAGATGLALFGDLVEDVAGTYTLSASATGASNVTSNSFIITAAAASKVSFVTQPSSTIAGATINAVTVQIADKFGNAVAGTSIGIAISPGTLSTGTTPLAANSAGQVVFGDLSENKTGTYTLTASAAALSASSSQFTITPSLATAKLSFVSQPNSTGAGLVLHAVTVQVADQFSNPITGVSIGVALSTGTLSAGTTPLISSAAGQVVFNDLVEDIAGTYNLVASSAGLANVTSGSFVIATAAAASLTFLSQPSSTIAGATLNPITVQVADKFGNLVSGFSVSIGLTVGTLSTGTSPSPSNSAGQAVFSNLSKDTVGTYTLAASATGLATVLSSPFTISPAAATGVLSFATEPNSTTAGTVLLPVTVRVADKFGNVVPGVAIGIATTSGSLSTGTTPISSNSSGLAVFGDLTEDLTGTYTLAASASGLTSVHSSAFVISPAAASKLSFVDQPVSTGVGSVLNSLTVQATDQFGNGVVSVPISLSLASGTLTGITKVSANTSGQAIFNNLAVTTAGVCNLTASAPAMTSVNSSAFTIGAGTAFKLSFVNQPTAAAAGSVIGPVTLLVVDKYGNGVANAPIGIGLVGTKLSTGSTPITTNSAGQAIFSDLTEDTAGSCTLSASTTGLANVLSSPFTITAGAAASVSFLTQPTSGTAGSTLGSITVNVADQFGNKVTSGLVAMSVSSGSLNGPTGATINALGQAVFNGLSAPQGGALTLTATDGLASATSNPFAATNSTDLLQFTTQPTSSIAAGSVLNAITATLTDASGDPLPGISLTMGLSSGALGGAVTATTNALGQATFSNLSVAIGGSYTLIASASGVPSATSNTFTVSAPASAKLVFLNQPGTTTAGNAIGTVTVEALDSLGHAVAGAPVVMTISSGSLSGTTTVTTNASGWAMFTGLSTTTAGSQSLLAITGSVTAASNSFTVLGGAAASVSFLSQPGNAIAGNLLNPVTAVVVDKYGNGVANVSVGLFVYTASTVTGTTTLTTNSAGQAVFTTLRVDKAGVNDLTLQVTGLTKATSNNFTVMPQLSSAKLSFVTQPASTTLNSTLSPVTVQIVDQFGNLVSNQSVSVRISTGTLSGTVTGITNSLGQVTFSKLSVGTKGTGLTLIVSAPGLASVTSNAFSID